MSRLPPCPLKIELDFTDARLTGFGGWPAGQGRRPLCLLLAKSNFRIDWIYGAAVQLE